MPWRPHDSDRPTRPGTGNATRHRTGKGSSMANSTTSSTLPAPKSRRRPPAGEVVLGVDTHRDAHVASVLSLTGAVLATGEFPTSAAGYRDLRKWVRNSGAVRRAGVEGTGSYGASLTRYLLAQGIDVFDVNWMDRADRRRRGKSDPLDAQNAARAVLSGRACARAKAGDGPVQSARMYRLTKASAVKARTQAINQLKAVLVTADPALREAAACRRPNGAVARSGCLPAIRCGPHAGRAVGRRRAGPDYPCRPASWRLRPSCADGRRSHRRARSAGGLRNVVRKRPRNPRLPRLGRHFGRCVRCSRTARSASPCDPRSHPIPHGHLGPVSAHVHQATDPAAPRGHGRYRGVRGRPNTPAVDRDLRSAGSAGRRERPPWAWWLWWAGA